jgi:glycosyltransferase involved in cell wall biosynthesis
MKILIGTGASQPDRCASKCFIRAAKNLGHDVCVAGAVYGRNDTGSPSIEAADIDVPDKPYPETYDYSFILNQCPWTPDLIIQLEPHFYFVGDKPDIPSFFWILDPHRGGIGHRDMAARGSFDAILITQPYFAKSYNDLGMKTYWVPQAYDQERIKWDPSITPECDIAFIGQTGLHDDILSFDKFDKDGYAYLDELPDQILLSSEHREYAERAQMLGYLMENFDVRIYADQLGSGYSRVIQKGEVGFQRSLFKDINLRVFEVPACGRILIADNVPNLEHIFQNGTHCLMYEQYGYDPFLPNFKLDYEQLWENVDFALSNLKRFEICEAGYEYVTKNHTFEKRVEQVIQIYEQNYKQKGAIK